MKRDYLFRAAIYKQTPLPAALCIIKHNLMKVRIPQI